MLRGSERIRLISMLGTLCILGLIIFRSMNSGTINSPAENRDNDQTQIVEKQQEPASAGKVTEAQKPAENETVSPGLTDEDPEEMAAAENAFQALTDGTVGIQSTDMFAYQRLFDWVIHQTFAEMKRRANHNVTFDDLMRTPNQFRGKLVQVDLNVRQAIPFEDHSLSDEKLYEIRGFSQDSGAWLYFVIAPDWPSGMKTGSNIQEQVRVEGYFLKIHGYLEAGAKPRAAPLKAPLLIGRVKRIASASGKATPADNTWLYYAAGGFVLLSFFFTLAQFFARRQARRRKTQLDGYKIERGQAWLDNDHPIRSEPPALPEESRDEAEEGFDFGKSP